MSKMVSPVSPNFSTSTFHLTMSWVTSWGSVIGYCLCIFLLSGQSFLSVPHTIPSADKGAHAILYAGLGWLWARAVQRSWPTQTAGMILFSSFVFTALYGASDEWHQFYVPERMADVRDVVADTIGGTLGGIGFVVWQCIAGWRLRRSPVADSIRSTSVIWRNTLNCLSRFFSQL